MSYFKQTQLIDQYGFKSANTPMEEQRVAEPTRLVGVAFSNDVVDTNFWTITELNGGTVSPTELPGCVTLNTNTAANGTTYLLSIQKARYISGVACKFRAQIQLGDTGEAGNTRYWGVSNDTDGAYFKLDGTTFYAATMYMTEETVVSVLPTPTTNVTTYEIVYTNGRVTFIINGVVVATHVASTRPWTADINLPIHLENYNNFGLATEHKLHVRVASVSALGKTSTEPSYYHFTGPASTVILKHGAGKIQRVIVNSSGGSSFQLIDSRFDVTPVISNIATISPMSLEFMCPFHSGLTLKTIGDGVDITIIYE